MHPHLDGHVNAAASRLSRGAAAPHPRRRRVSSEARRRRTKTRSALRTPTWWIQEPGAAVPPGDVTIDALPSTTVRVPRRFRWTLGVLRRTDESYEGAVSPPRRLFVGAAEKRPQTSSAHLMLPGGPCTQSDEDLNHLMTIGSDRRCRRPKRSTSPRDEARSPHLDARKKIKQKHRTKFRVQFLSPGWRRPDCLPYPCT